LEGLCQVSQWEQEVSGPEKVHKCETKNLLRVPFTFTSLQIMDDRSHTCGTVTTVGSFSIFM